MFRYNVLMAIKSLRRNVAMSVLIVGAIALGVGVSALFSTMRHALAKDPIPARSDVLYYVRLDSWDPIKPYPGDDPRALPPQITYRDMVGIMKSHIPVRQTAAFQSRLAVTPDSEDALASSRALWERVPARLTYADFFAMFDVPFRFGGPWDKKADSAAEQVAVLSQQLNEKLFGSENSVGKTLRIEGRVFRVVGVLDAWSPAVKYYDMNNPVDVPEQVYLPFELLRPMRIRSFGSNDGWGPSPSVPGFDAIFVSETTWIQMWVELPDAAHVVAYRAFLDAYALDQRKAGRFQRPLNNRVTPLMAWLAELKIVPAQLNTMAIVSLLFLAVCALNLMGLLLAKFLARAHEVGIRRALGARRSDIFVQYLVECELVALVGGLFGLLLARLALVGVNNWMKTLLARADLFQLDFKMGLLALALALGAGLCAGAYPAWRVCRVAPALHLKWS